MQSLPSSQHTYQLKGLCAKPQKRARPVNDQDPENRTFSCRLALACHSPLTSAVPAQAAAKRPRSGAAPSDLTVSALAAFREDVIYGEPDAVLPIPIYHPALARLSDSISQIMSGSRVGFDRLRFIHAQQYYCNSMRIYEKEEHRTAAIKSFHFHTFGSNGLTELAFYCDDKKLTQADLFWGTDLPRAPGVVLVLGDTIGEVKNGRTGDSIAQGGKVYKTITDELEVRGASSLISRPNR